MSVKRHLGCAALSMCALTLASTLIPAEGARADGPSLLLRRAVVPSESDTLPSEGVIAPIRPPPPIAPPSPTPVTAFPAPPRVTRLPNGLDVVTLGWNSPGIVAYYTLVRVGSRDEVEPGHSGFAHLFEHMMFRGTARFPGEAYERIIQELGADNNAYTTPDFTLYHMTLPASQLERAIELEGDRFQHLDYDETQFRTETGAVLGEYNKGASSPYLRMEEALSELAFSRHTYRHTTLGYLRDIQAMPEKLAYSRAFFRRFYTPDATTIFIVGDVEHDPAVELVRRHYGAWRGRRDRPRIPVEPEPTRGAEQSIVWDGQTPPRLWVGYRVPAFEAGRTDAERARALRETAALEIVHGLAFAESSPLYQRLVVDAQSVLELGTSAGQRSRDPGLFTIYVTLKPGQDAGAIRDEIQAELGRIARGEASEARVRAVQSHMRYGLLMGLETPNAAADLMASFYAVSGGAGSGDLTALDRYLQALADVTPAEVAAAAARYLIESRRFVVTLSPRAAEAR